MMTLRSAPLLVWVLWDEPRRLAPRYILGESKKKCHRLVRISFALLFLMYHTSSEHAPLTHLFLTHLTPHPSLLIALVPSPSPLPCCPPHLVSPISRSSCSPRSSNGPDCSSNSSPPASLPPHPLISTPSACLFILINPKFLLSLNHNILSFLFCLSA
ncbi:hypothetical protein EV363DRAFT_1321318 [Boletus edulis]|nr:hypothetical protein EV363DRAFT_1321318 [Boletus edulis]